MIRGSVLRLLGNMGHSRDIILLVLLHTRCIGTTYTVAYMSLCVDTRAAVNDAHNDIIHVVAINIHCRNNTDIENHSTFPIHSQYRDHYHSQYGDQYHS